MYQWNIFQITFNVLKKLPQYEDESKGHEITILP